MALDKSLSLLEPQKGHWTNRFLWVLSSAVEFAYEKMQVQWFLISLISLCFYFSLWLNMCPFEILNLFWSFFQDQIAEAAIENV